MTIPVCVSPEAEPRDCSSSGRARPKSRSFTPCGVRNTLDGLRSRWTTPRSCSAESAASISSPIGNVSATLSGPRRRRSASDSPFQQLHGDEQLATVFADFVDLADVRMIDACRGPRLAPEALPRRFVVGQRRHRLERDRALEARVARRIDNAHAALTQLPRDRVRSDVSGKVVSNVVAGDVRKGKGNAGAPVIQS